MRRAEFRHWRLADCLQRSREDLKLARRRTEVLLLVFAVPSFERNTHRPPRRTPQHRGRYAARREVMRKRGLDISIPEAIPKTRANGQIEHDIDVGASFTASRNDRGPKLDVLARTQIEGEANAQTLSFPPAGNRKHDIGVRSGRD